MPSVTFQQAEEHFKKNGFYRIAHPVVLHHLRKDFADLDVVDDAFFIKPVGEDFLHVALIKYDTWRFVALNPDKQNPDFDGKSRYTFATHQDSHVIQIRYTCAGDDLLYGLRTKFNSGGSIDPDKDLDEINEASRMWENYPGLPKHPNALSLRNHPRYVRKRFRHGRTKAKIRAFFVMLSDKWKEWRS